MIRKDSSIMYQYNTIKINLMWLKRISFENQKTFNKLFSK
jgi:hypothetical protein